MEKTQKEAYRKLKDILTLSLKSIESRRLRSWLTILGVVIGVSVIVSLMSLAQGLQDSVEGQFDEFGTDKIFITATASLLPPLTVSEGFTDEDVEDIRKVRGVSDATGIPFKSARAEFSGSQRFPFVIGIDTNIDREFFEEGFLSDLERGRFFTDDSTDEALIGWGYANQDKWFGRTVATGDRIEIEGKAFEVVGTLGRIGNDQDDTNIYIPLESYRSLFNDETLFQIIVKVDDENNIDRVAERIKDLMRDKRGLERGAEDFSVQTSDQLLESFGNIINVINIVVISIAGISMVVGGIGISNAMFTSVYERRREIGIMKAVGAGRSHIFRIFLAEAMLVGLAGGIAGILIGFGISVGVSSVARNVFGSALVSTSFNPAIVAFALLFALGIGLVSGSVPARNAGRLSPVEAIRK